MITFCYTASQLFSSIWVVIKSQTYCRHINSTDSPIPLYGSLMSLELFSLVTAARFDTFGNSALSSILGSNGGTEIYPSYSALIKDPKDKLPLFGRITTNREHWTDFKVCESESPTLLCSST